MYIPHVAKDVTLTHIPSILENIHVDKLHRRDGIYTRVHAHVCAHAHAHTQKSTRINLPA